MRDPHRLPALYGVLQLLHQQHPDMRFAQFIECINSYIKRKGRDPFYVEDDEYIKLAEEYVLQKLGRIN